MKIYIKRKLYNIKNSIKYFFKRDLDINELFHCASLTEGGYMSQKTYEKTIRREYK